MKRYLVGGAVRDRLLGLPVKDRDFVVVGATPDEMFAQGFLPVGKDFPVFLHPQTHEEYALARTERKTAPGYKGFVFHAEPDVTLEQDLARRDLTINAMAEAEDGSVIDPFNGQADLRAQLLRHVSRAFLEDPVRILRVARFSARFVDFVVVPETAALMQSMVENGEVDALIPERAWQEFSRGLMEIAPSRMIDVLHTCGALARLLPVVAQCVTRELFNGGSLLTSLDSAAGASASLEVRFAIMMQATALSTYPASGPADTAQIEVACKKLKVPRDCRDIAVMTGREHGVILAGCDTAEQIMSLLERCDVFRKPARFGQMLQAVSFIQIGQSSAMQSIHRWQLACQAALSVNSGVVAANVQLTHPGQPMHINAAVRAARIAAVAFALHQ